MLHSDDLIVEKSFSSHLCFAGMHMHADLPTVAHSLCCTLDPGSKPHACLFAQRRRNRAENSGCVIHPDAAAPLIIIT